MASDLQNPWSSLELTDMDAGRNLTEGGGGGSLSGTTLKFVMSFWIRCNSV